MGLRRVFIPSLAAALAAGGVVLVTSAPAVAETITETFNATGAAQEFVVPSGVTEIEATTCGAQAGASAHSANGVAGPSTAGALGGCATATVAVTPGETLTIMVGGAGGDAAATTSVTAGVSASAQGGSAGFNGGTSGGAGTSTSQSVTNVFPCNIARIALAGATGGSGGASDIRRVEADPSTRVLVGGGGGAAGSHGAATTPVFTPFVCPDSGIETGVERDQGTSASSSQAGPDVGAAPEGVVGASFTNPGLGGAGGGDPADDGEDGTAAGALAGGAGGGGGASSDENGESGGGASSIGPLGASLSNGGPGGGGFLGGGGGGAGQTSTTPPAAGGGGGGGGGSGFGPAGVVFDTGVQAGDGFVTITYETPAPPPPPPPPTPGPEPEPAAVVRIQPAFTG